MQHTVGPILPISALPRHMLQIFSVNVTEIKGALQWPLNVYGHVAVRDSLDRKRNYLFRRSREDCQTLASPEASVSPVVTMRFYFTFSRYVQLVLFRKNI